MRQLPFILSCVGLLLTAACGGKNKGEDLGPIGPQPHLEYGRLCTLLELCERGARPVDECVGQLPARPTDKEGEPVLDDECSGRAMRWATCIAQELELSCDPEAARTACIDAHRADWPEDRCGEIPRPMRSR